MSLPGKRLEIGGVHYHVSDQGEGERVVLLLHGMPDTSSLWRHQVPKLLGAGFRVIAPDMLGYGKTEKPEAAERYAGDRVVADLLTLIATLDLPRMDLVGHDWGAFASWELVLRRPELFRRHVALSVGHPGALFGELSTRSLKENWYMYLNGQEAAPDLYRLNGCEFLRKYVLSTHPEIEEVCARLEDPAAMRAMLNWDRGNPMASFYLAVLTGELEYPRCQVPTLGIWSSGDQYMWEEQMRRSAEWMEAEWRYERMENASHWLTLDRPEEVGRLLLEWLAKG